VTTTLGREKTRAGESSQNGVERARPLDCKVIMSALQRLIPNAHLLEVEHIDVAAPAVEVWERVRQGELARPLAIRALFTVRNLASRGRGTGSPSIRIDSLRSSPEQPGFQILADEPPHELAVGAIGKVWRLAIPFVHVADEDAYASFAAPGFVKVAWAIRVSPRTQQTCHVEFEVRVAATDDDAWRKFRRYFRVIGPFSRFIRRSLLRGLARQAAGSERAAVDQAA
jgi:hypothetical protein